MRRVSANQKQELLMVDMFFAGSTQNEEYLSRTSLISFLQC